MKPSDIVSLTNVSDPQLSPDGSHVAYVVSRIDEDANTYRSQIWVVATDGSSPARALTAGTHRDSSPRWSPDGRQLAFTSARAKDPAGKTKASLHLLPFGVPGETVTLAEADEGFGGLTFSPDGAWLAVSHRVRGEHYQSDEIGRRPPRKIESLEFMLNGEGFVFDRPSNIHVVPTDGSAGLRNVAPCSSQCGAPAWFGDSRRIAFAVEEPGTSFSTDIAVVDVGAAPVDGAAPYTLLTDGSGRFTSPLVVEGDERIVASGHDDVWWFPQNGHLGTLEVDAVGTPEWITQDIDRTWMPFMAGQAPMWMADGAILAGIEDRGNIHLYRVTLDDEPAKLVIGGDRSVTGWAAGELDGKTVVAFTATSRTAPTELFVAIDGAETQLTNVSASFVARTAPQSGEHFLAESDGHEVDCWLYTPHDFDPSKTYPMLFNIHGGPFTQYGNYYFDEFQMEAAAGYVVLCSNPRGGSGRDNAWSAAILGPKHRAAGTGWGGADYDDCMAVVDAALERYDFIDPNRLGVLGGSYGGYMTTWIVTHSDRFAAACSERAANNLLSLEFASDIAGVFSSEMGPTFVDDPDEYVRMSPTTYVKDLNTPLLIVHSEEDLRCPVDQATQLFVACQLLGKEVEYYLFPGETHELSRSGTPLHRKQRAELILDFFDRHLQPSD